MMQGRMMKRWTPRYMVVDNGFITYYDKKSLVGTKKNKVGWSVWVSISAAACGMRRGQSKRWLCGKSWKAHGQEASRKTCSRVRFVVC